MEEEKGHKRRKLKHQKTPTFIRGFCARLKPPNAHVQSKYWSQHVIQAQGVLQQNTFSLYLSLLTLNKQNGEDTLIYQHLLKQFRFIQFEATKIGAKRRAVFDSAVLLDKLAAADCIAHIFRVIKFKNLSNIGLFCNGEWFGFSQKVFYIKQQSSGLIERAKQRNVTVTEIKQSKQKTQNEQDPKHISPYTEFPVALRVDGSGFSWLAGFQDAANELEIEIVPDIVLISCKDNVTTGWNRDDTVLSNSECIICKAPGDLLWRQTGEAFIVCGSCLLKKDVQKHVPQPIDEFGWYKIDENIKESFLLPEYSVLSATPIDTIEFAPAEIETGPFGKIILEQKEKEPEKPKESSKPKLQQPEKKYKEHKYTVRFTTDPHKTIKQARAKYDVEYAHKSMHKTSHNKDCVICHHRMYTGRSTATWCNKCHFGIHVHCGHGSKYGTKRICFGCMSWKNRERIQELEESGNFENTKLLTVFC